jgi:phosphoglucomutase
MFKPGDIPQQSPGGLSMVSAEAAANALAEMILSPSGWRGIFTANGSEEERGGELSAVHGLIAAAGAAVFAEFLKSRGPKAASPELQIPIVVLGRDTRPTGEAIADIMIRSFLAAGCDVRYAGIAAAPEIMAYTAHYAKTRPKQNTGFCYISASHNPIGHNGLKFGLDDGGVLEGTEALALIRSLRDFFSGPVSGTSALAVRVENEDPERVYREEQGIKEEALKAYRDFSAVVISGRPAGQAAGQSSDSASEASPPDVLKAITAGLKERPLGLAVDYNGSARTTSIDGEFFRSLGLGCHAMNANPGEIAHAIIPEGDSLEPCRIFLEELHQKDPSVILGYVPDCDGDRGNLVIWDDDKGTARSLEAQEVFALACVSELAHLVWTGELCYDASGKALARTAVAVNGPTSMRIDRIAEAFGAEVFRAEVGEANVVNLARRLRKEGYLVRILGEGSNGGNITHPSAVRDPLATVFALVKLLSVRSGGSAAAGRGFFGIWNERNNMGEKGKAGEKDGGPGVFTLADIIASLPGFTTTGVATPEAKLQVHTRDHALLKERYQRVFLEEWEAKRDDLQRRFNISGWEARACIGTEEKRKLSRFGEAETGGLKIVFTGSSGRETAFVWMRGSKTEPVFRIMADAEGVRQTAVGRPAGQSAGQAAGAELERELIQWQRAMVSRADSGA